MPIAELVGTVDITVGATPRVGPVGVSSPHAVARARADASQMVERVMPDLLNWEYSAVGVFGLHLL
jgi:hypothetical protein